MIYMNIFTLIYTYIHIYAYVCIVLWTINGHYYSLMWASCVGVGLMRWDLPHLMCV